MKARILILMIFILPSTTILNSQTFVQSGPVFGDWFLSGSPYLIQGDIHLPSDQRLRIWPGVQVIFQGQYGFELQGKLDATGTVSDSITFTFFDTTGYSQNNYSGWSGLLFNGMNYGFPDSSIMAYCNIEYSKFNGIICLYYPLLSIRDSEIRYNKASGLLLNDFSDIRITSTVIRDNNSDGLALNSSSPQISNFTVKNNKGSGISINGNGSGYLITSFINGKISNNKSSSSGGGAYLNNDAIVYFENITIENNQAVDGGGIYCGMASCQMYNVVLIGNSSANNGGAIFGSFFSVISIKSGLIAKNISGHQGGGAFINNGTINLYNSTVSGNIAGISGSGLLFNTIFAPASVVHNSIIYDNIGSEIEAFSLFPVISFSDIKGGFPGIGNIDADPLFTDPLNNNYNLSWTSFPEENTTKSPCIDSGDPDSTEDPDGTLSDMGAFYFDQGIYTSLNNISLDSDFEIYPNPAHDFVRVANVFGYNKLVLTNLSGTVLLTQDIDTGMNELNISDLNPGVYILQLTSNEMKKEVRKIIKK